MTNIFFFMSIYSPRCLWLIHDIKFIKLTPMGMDDFVPVDNKSILWFYIISLTLITDKQVMRVLFEWDTRIMPYFAQRCRRTNDENWILFFFWEKTTKIQLQYTMDCETHYKSPITMTTLISASGRSKTVAHISRRWRNTMKKIRRVHWLVYISSVSVQHRRHLFLQCKQENWAGGPRFHFLFHFPHGFALFSCCFYIFCYHWRARCRVSNADVDRQSKFIQLHNVGA